MKVVPRKPHVFCTYRFSSFPQAEDEGRFFIPPFIRVSRGLDEKYRPRMHKDITLLSWLS